MTTQTVDAESACPAPTARRRLRRPLVALRRPFDAIPQPLWDGLAARNPWATPFSQWAFHRSWWSAYGATAHEQTLIVVDPSDPDGSDRPIAIVPLMHRHEVEPVDAETHTTMRHADGALLTTVEPTAKAVFFGATYHADYATVLCDPVNLRDVADAVVAHLAGESPDPVDRTDAGPWDVIDLRRLRCGDPAADELVAAFQRAAPTCRWAVTSEREDVCPTVALPDGVDFDGFLATLEKKERHEIRRKIRRAEAAGEVRLTTSTAPLADLDDFIDLHQKRWSAEGLFPATPGGECSRRFFRHLFRHFGPGGPIRLTRLTVGGRLVASGIHFDDGERILYYNAGVDPDARDFSPGVLMVAHYIQQAMDDGRRELDFLRGNEPYKYEWGAVDEPIQRILVRREVA